MPIFGVTIFHTNDMHGRLADMAGLSTFAKQHREQAKNEGRITYLWDAGDAADRRDRSLSITKCSSIGPVLNAMGYDLQTLGNAVSLPYGLDAVTKMAARLDFPLLAANLRDGDGPLVEGVRADYVLEPYAGVKIGVLGLTAPWGNLYEIFGLHLPGFLELAESWVRKMKSQGFTALGLLSHLGIDDDRRVAKRVPELDFIIGGHSHTRLDQGEIVNGVLIAQAGDFASALGSVDLSIDSSTGRIIEKKARLIDVPATIQADPLVEDVFRSIREEAATLRAEIIAVCVHALDLDYYNECPLGNVTADAIRERMGAEAALLFSGHFAQGVPSGEVSLGDLDAATFSSANPYVSNVSGKTILEAIEKSLDESFQKTQPGGFRGAPFGLTQVSNMRIWTDERREVGNRVLRIEIGGSEIELGWTYRVAHTDSESSPNNGILHLDDGIESQYEVPTIVREVLQDYLKRNSPLEIPQGKRWVRIRE